MKVDLFHIVGIIVVLFFGYNAVNFFARSMPETGGSRSSAESLLIVAFAIVIFTGIGIVLYGYFVH